MVEKFNKIPLSRNSGAVRARGACVAALGAVFFAAASAAAPTAAAPTAVAQPMAAPPQGSAPTAVAGFSFVKSLGGIDEYRLDSNGLTVLLVPDHSAPVVTFQVTYQVGSRNEVTGTTGATHILEHMMFKGSEGFN
ncbi:MAG TPA: insulinase family protein, partial [Steroidobacteraceae bacterium]